MSNRSFVGRVEILGRDEILGRERRGRRHRIQDLKARAAAGDPRAVAKLQKLQAALAAPVSSTATPNPYAATTYAATPYAATPYAATTYPASYQQPAYQSPYFDPSLSQDPYGPPPQPTIDVFQGDDSLEEIVSSGHDEILGSSFIGDDERAYAADGGMADKMALQRRITSSGSNRHLAFVRGEADTDATSRQTAKKILEQSADSKTIKKSDLRRAIELYAGNNATTQEKTAVGSKMLEYLTKKKIKIEG
jgi:hypothetical protein